MVTFLRTVLRARPATKPVRPERAPLESPRESMGAFTAEEVMLTMRPNPRAIMPSTVAFMSSMGVSILASMAASHWLRSHCRKSPGGGPPALLTRMSGAGQAASTAWRPAGVAMSLAMAATLTPWARRIDSAVASSSLAVRALMTRSTPAAASASAQARPSPLLEAQTMALRPRIPRSMDVSFSCRLQPPDGRCPRRRAGRVSIARAG